MEVTVGNKDYIISIKEEKFGDFKLELTYTHNALSEKDSWEQTIHFNPYALDDIIHCLKMFKERIHHG